MLAQALDVQVPLLERLRFLCISSSILDEFFEIRVAGLKQQLEWGLARSGPDGLGPQETLTRIASEAREIVDEQYRTLNEVLLPALDAENIRVFRRTEWGPNIQRFVTDYFHREVRPVLTPLRLDPAHPFPRVANKSLNFIVSLEGKDAFGRAAPAVVIQAPRILPRLIAIPPEESPGEHDFVLLSSVIHANVASLFPGLRVTGCYQFRVTRNSDLWVDEEEIDDLLRAIKGELPRRLFGDAVRLEVPDNCPEETINFLAARFELSPADVYQVNGPVNLHRLDALHGLVDRPDLKYRPFVPGMPAGLRRAGSLFAAISRRDVLLHHPYQSFAPVVELVSEAARDPDVLAIRMTLYRTGSGSRIVEALLEAARAGKEVSVCIELRARFDEERNIDLATQLQEAGAKVTYGVVGFKTHAKMLLVVRREQGAIRRYVHLGTGNYHAGTARAYTDFGLLSADPVIAEDVQRLFESLTGVRQDTRLSKLDQAPFTLHRRILELIEAEAAEARAGRPARIVAKMNTLLEAETIRALYAASQAGVSVDLIVRGVCALRPGVPGVSENIRVRSIVGRFLEHHRVFHFHHAGEDLVLLSSADWMPRNFFRRVETCFPVDDPVLKARVIRESLELPLANDAGAWELGADGRYVRVQRASGEGLAAQELLLEEHAR